MFSIVVVVFLQVFIAVIHSGGLDECFFSPTAWNTVTVIIDLFLSFGSLIKY